MRERRIFDEAADGAGESGCILRIHQQAAVFVVQHLWDAAHAGRDHGARAGHGFDQGEGQRFRARGQHADCGLLPQLADAGRVHRAQELNGAVELEMRGKRAQGFALRTFARDLQLHGDVLFAQQRHGVEQHIEAFVMGQPRDREKAGRKRAWERRDLGRAAHDVAHYVDAAWGRQRGLQAFTRGGGDGGEQAGRRAEFGGGGFEGAAPIGEVDVLGVEGGEARVLYPADGPRLAEAAAMHVHE